MADARLRQGQSGSDLRPGKVIMVDVDKPRAFTVRPAPARLLIDVRTQFALHDRIENANFAFVAADLKFDAAAGSSHPTYHIETWRSAGMVQRIRRPAPLPS